MAGQILGKIAAELGEWIEQLNQRVKMLKELALQVDGQKKVRYWCHSGNKIRIKNNREEKANFFHESSQEESFNGSLTTITFMVWLNR